MHSQLTHSQLSFAMRLSQPGSLWKSDLGYIGLCVHQDRLLQRKKQEGTMLDSRIFKALLDRNNEGGTSWGCDVAEYLDGNLHLPWLPGVLKLQRPRHRRSGLKAGSCWMCYAMQSHHVTPSRPDMTWHDLTWPDRPGWCRVSTVVTRCQTCLAEALWPRLKLWRPWRRLSRERWSQRLGELWPHHLQKLFVPWTHPDHPKSFTSIVDTGPRTLIE